jgi:hypothetical protein
MWPFKNREYTPLPRLGIVEAITEGPIGQNARAMRQEIADLKDSNARLADALAAVKERAGDTYGP